MYLLKPKQVLVVWLLVRIINLVWSAFVAIRTYSRWSTAIKLDNFYKWIAWWVIFWQIMASFYVAEWCVGGF